MRLFNWVNLTLIACLATLAAPVSASCLPKVLERRILPETIATVCKGDALIPFKVQARYIGEGGYHGYETKAQRGKKSTVYYDVGIVSLSGGPIPSKAKALKMVAHFERRRKCPVEDVRYSSAGPTLFRVVCSQGDKR